LGRVTRKKVCQPPAPSTRAASSSSFPVACITGISSRATKGKVTKVVARASPGNAKTIRMSCSPSQGPKVPWRPKSRMKIIPEITGETAKGRSMRVMRAFFPGKSNLAMAQAAPRPKIRFRGTAMAAVSRVSFRAERARGSVTAST